jgi:hypothetical protein
MSDAKPMQPGRAPAVVTGPPPRPTPDAPHAPHAPGRPGGQEAVGPRPAILECADLAARHGCHLSTDQVWRLVALRHRYRAGGIPEPHPEPRVGARLRFARWLYLQGRISG